MPTHGNYNGPECHNGVKQVTVYPRRSYTERNLFWSRNVGSFHAL